MAKIFLKPGQIFTIHGQLRVGPSGTNVDTTIDIHEIVKFHPPESSKPADENSIEIGTFNTKNSDGDNIEHFLNFDSTTGKFWYYDDLTT